ncbi:hypothetical protein Sste5346_001514 [Sporothrix stenoceras]|uniref:Zn(2)-C6 fungal-type domain-containing protein n=1 Tax=Sporothrix stenoceras TaxID=5173 RepID=A0ABR3ZNZ1_9PEZI
MDDGRRDDSLDDRPTKKPRTARACLQCRSRKQRCLPRAADNSISFTFDLNTPCQRCTSNGTTCSFETDLDSRTEQQPELGPARLSQLVVDLHQRIDMHEARIEQLEGRAKTQRETPERAPTVPSRVPSPPPPQSTPRRYVERPPAPQTDFNMDTVQLEAPIATLQSLGAISPESMSTSQSTEGRRQTTTTVDPVRLGVLTKQEARKAVNTYFSSCHPWAPFLDEQLGRDVDELRMTHPLVFLAVVCIGLQFWSSSTTTGLHPRYFQVSSLWDTSISRLLLTPTPSDASLDAVCSLLLYSQWMPYTQDQDQDSGQPKSRYNDLSAWVVFGLAVRYASFLGLERRALLTNSTTSSTLLRESRTWLNLVTYDCNLTLTSGLPSSINATRVESMAREFGQHRLAQFPGDGRYAALVELACILQRAREGADGRGGAEGALSSSSPSSITVGNIDVLKRANMGFEDWQRHWLPKLRHTHMQHNQLPFTSLRWYQLALNSSALRRILSLGPSDDTTRQTAPLQVWVLGALETSLTAAAQILFSLSTGAAESVWSLSSQDPSTFPLGVFVVDPLARRSLDHAVDSIWVSHAFALIFLVLCYVRGQVDDDLQMCSLAPVSTAHRAPTKPRTASILARLAQLAVDIFRDGGSALRPIDKIGTLVANAASLVLAVTATATTTDRADVDAINGNGNPSTPPAVAGDAGDVHDHPLQNLFDLMGDSDMTWPATLSVFGDEWTM